MRLAAIFAHFAIVSNALKLRGNNDGLDVYEEEQEEVFTYTPSNSNTRPPSSFSDPVTPDTAYHELVPALQVLNELITTTPKPSKKRNT
jgi:hypothetical protein